MTVGPAMWESAGEDNEGAHQRLRWNRRPRSSGAHRKESTARSRPLCGSNSQKCGSPSRIVWVTTQCLA